MKVHVPTPLHDYTGQRAVVEASGATLGEVLDDLDARHPGVRFRIVDEQGEIRTHIKLFVNTREAGGLDARLGPDDEVHIIAALSGG